MSDPENLSAEQRAQLFWQHVQSGDHLQALSAIWGLPAVYNFTWLSTHLKDYTYEPTSLDLVLSACRQAVRSGREQLLDKAEVTQWFAERLAALPAALVDYGIGNEAADYRDKLLRACLRTAQGCLTAEWTSNRVAMGDLATIAAETGFAPGFLRLIADSILPPSVEVPDSQPQAQEASVVAFLVQGNKGIPARLTVRLVRPGRGDFYPTLASAWVHCEQTFAEALTRAWSQVRTDGARDVDVCWQLTRYDKQEIAALVGASMGAAVTVTTAVLLARAGITLPDGLQSDAPAVDLDQVGIAAALDEHGNLAHIAGLWEKLDTEAIGLANRGLLRVVLVASDQPGVPPEYVLEDAKPFRVVQATSVADALRVLAELSRPRLAVQLEEQKRCAELNILGSINPFALHYQHLPLLQEVKKEELLRDRRRPDDEEEGTGNLRTIEIQRWEEHMRDREVSYAQPVEFDHLVANFASVVKPPSSAVPRFVVLGPPGSGKTTLGQYLMGRVASGDLRLDGRRYVPTRVRLREWQGEKGSSSSLSDYLANRYGALEHAPDVKQWRQWLARGEVWLFLDGLDEIASESGFREVLRTAIADVPTCPIVLTCRTVSFEQHQQVCPQFPVFTIGGLSQTQQAEYIRKFPHASYDPSTVIEQIRRQPLLQPLAASPLLLSIMCLVANEKDGVQFLTTRSKLYRKAVDNLLKQNRRIDVDFPERPPDIRRRRVLERTALAVFASQENDRELLFTEERIVDALTVATKPEDYGVVGAGQFADALLRDLVGKCGLLQGGPERGYYFLHLTIQEYLAAAALARMINDTKTTWDTEVEIQARTVTVRELIDKKAWDPRWQEVITLLAGQLADPVPLLEMLSDAKKDDMFRHRLALAALCLPELLGVQETANGSPAKSGRAS
jgi:hypothetical protein